MVKAILDDLLVPFVDRYQYFKATLRKISFTRQRFWVPTFSATAMAFATPLLASTIMTADIRPIRGRRLLLCLRGRSLVVGYIVGGLGIKPGQSFLSEYRFIPGYFSPYLSQICL